MMLEVKLLRSPTTFDETDWIPPAMDAANAEPGKDGSDILEGAWPTWTGPPEEEDELEWPKPGS